VQAVPFWLALLAHALFGTVDSSAPGSWQATLTFSGRPVTVELVIDGNELPAESLASTLRLSDDIDSLDASARAALRRDLDQNEDSAVGLYSCHHLDELSDSTLLGLFGVVERDTLDADGFLGRLTLLRIGIHPENAARSVVCDYSLGAELTDYLLVVSFGASGQVTGVEMES
jgi:hypothetical protein